MSFKDSTTILLIGSDTTLGYLLKRYAERSGYQLIIDQKIPLAVEVQAIKPIMIIFLSTELLETAQTLVEDLANYDISILVCSSVADEAKARQLGADYCLSHLLTYDSFYQALVATGSVKHV